MTVELFPIERWGGKARRVVATYIERHQDEWKDERAYLKGVKNKLAQEWEIAGFSAAEIEAFQVRFHAVLTVEYQRQLHLLAAAKDAAAIAKAEAQGDASARVAT